MCNDHPNGYAVCRYVLRQNPVLFTPQPPSVAIATITIIVMLALRSLMTNEKPSLRNIIRR